MKLTTIGDPSWIRNDIKDKLDEFAELYKKRPIENNAGGMLSPSMFASWFIIQHMKFKNIIESGVWYGQGTWFFEQANPNAKIFSIDPRLDYRKYISHEVTYYNKDFFTQNWNDLDKKNTLCFFDDHINDFERVKYLSENKFKYAIFEDNYPIGEGCQNTLKQKFETDGEDSDYLKSVIKTYYEFPPIIKSERNRWDKPWNTYTNPSPILSSIKKNLYQIYQDEANNYNWLAYVEFN